MLVYNWYKNLAKQIPIKSAVYNNKYLVSSHFLWLARGSVGLGWRTSAGWLCTSVSRPPSRTCDWSGHSLLVAIAEVQEPRTPHERASSYSIESQLLAPHQQSKSHSKPNSRSREFISVHSEAQESYMVKSNMSGKYTPSMEAKEGKISDKN